MISESSWHLSFEPKASTNMALALAICLKFGYFWCKVTPETKNVDRRTDEQ